MSELNTSIVIRGIDRATEPIRRISESMGRIGATEMKPLIQQTKFIGLSLEEAVVLAGLLGDEGLKGGRAGTSLRAMMLRLASPTGEAKKALQHFGISTVDSEGKIRNMVDVLKDLDAAMNAQSAGDRTHKRMRALKGIFGEEPAGAIKILMKAARNGLLDQRLKGVLNGTGATKEAQKEMADNLAGAAIEYQSAVNTLNLAHRHGDPAAADAPGQANH